MVVVVVGGRKGPGRPTHQVLRQVFPQIRSQVLHDHQVRQVDRVVLFEGLLEVEELPHGDGVRVHVDCAVVPVTTNHLGREPLDRAAGGHMLSLVAIVNDARETKVGHLDDELVRQKQVLGFEGGGGWVG